MGMARLRKLKSIPGTATLKGKIVKQGVWAKALHASEGTIVPLTAIRKLRTNTARALGIHRPGVKSLLALTAFGDGRLDPEYAETEAKFMH